MIEITAQFQNASLVQVEQTTKLQAGLSLELSNTTSEEPTNRVTRDFEVQVANLVLEDIHWYLETYCTWPAGLIRERALRIEAKLAKFGTKLYNCLIGSSLLQSDSNVFVETLASDSECIVTIQMELNVDTALAPSSFNHRIASNKLISLPWELMHNGDRYIFADSKNVQLRRSIVRQRSSQFEISGRTIRILLASPRPMESSHYFDHRVTAAPLLNAAEEMNNAVEVVILTPPTFEALRNTLEEARESNKPFDVFHFDGHGAYDNESGQGFLCFESRDDQTKHWGRRDAQVSTQQFASLLRSHDVGLIILEACQSAKSEKDISASVAGSIALLEGHSVLAMSHSILVAASQLFMLTFYTELIGGSELCRAVGNARRVLYHNRSRGIVEGAGSFELSDWYVPVLFQNNTNQRLFRPDQSTLTNRSRSVAQAQTRHEKEEPAESKFVGRSRELLILERILQNRKYTVLHGLVGEGKTTLAKELCQWLVRTRQYDRHFYLSSEAFESELLMMETLGRQVNGLGLTWSAGDYENHDEALKALTSELNEMKTLITIDGVESYPPHCLDNSIGESRTEGLLEWIDNVLDNTTKVKFIIISTSSLPEPFNDNSCSLFLDAMSTADAVELLRNELIANNVNLSTTKLNLETLEEAVNRLNCHAQSVIALAPELVGRQHVAPGVNLNRLVLDCFLRTSNKQMVTLVSSVEHTLRKLDSELFRLLKSLAFFQGQGHAMAIELVLEADHNEANRLFEALQRIGLLRQKANGHCVFHPVLSYFLSSILTKAERLKLKRKWFQGMVYFYCNHLDNLQVNDSATFIQIASADINNIYGFTEIVKQQKNPELSLMASCIFGNMAQSLKLPHLRSYMTKLRKKSLPKVSGWSKSVVLARILDIGELIENEQFTKAALRSSELLRKALHSRAKYQGSEVEIAKVYDQTAHALRRSGRVEEAYKITCDAMLFLSENEAKIDISTALSLHRETAECLAKMGKFQAAADICTSLLQKVSAPSAKHNVAKFLGQLGTMLFRRGMIKEALDAHLACRRIFEDIGDTHNLAVALNHMGVINRKLGNLQAAEQNLLQELKLSTIQQNHSAVARCMTNLGNVYQQMGKKEDSLEYYLRASEESEALGDRENRWNALSNYALVASELNLHEKALDSIKKVIAEQQGMDLHVKPWRTFQIEFIIERNKGDVVTAKVARNAAIQALLEHRRSGGESTCSAGTLCEGVLRRAKAGEMEEFNLYIQQPIGVELKGIVSPAFIDALRKVASGERGTGVVDDLNLRYEDAVEILILIERLKSIDM